MLLKEAKVTKPLTKAGKGATSGASACMMHVITPGVDVHSNNWYSGIEVASLHIVGMPANLYYHKHGQNHNVVTVQCPILLKSGSRSTCTWAEICHASCTQARAEVQHNDKGKLWVEKRTCHVHTCSWGVAQKAVRHPDKLLHKSLLGVKRVTQSICRQQKQCQLLLVTHMLQQ